MDIEAQIFNIFDDFIKDLSKTFPEIKNCLYRNYETELVGENKTLELCPKLKDFLDKIKDNEKLIANKDVTFFDLELDLLEEICFKNLWAKNISDKTRETIWKYLQTFSVIAINLNSSDKLKDLLDDMGKKEITKDDISDKQTAKELKKLKELTENLTAEETAAGVNEFDNMFGGLMDSDIGKIAKEVADGMDINKMFGGIADNEMDPDKIMQNMMNPETMGNIFKNISGVIEQKVSDGTIDTDKLKGDAENICKTMKDNPLFGDLMGKMTPPQAPDPQAPDPQAPDPQAPDPQAPKPLTELSKEEKRKILKQKIEAKKKERTNQ